MGKCNCRYWGSVIVVDYEGDFVDSRFCGHGTQISADGTRYDGEFSGSKMNGLGDLKHANGARYQGYFKDNTFEGIGRLTYPDGRTMSGRWKKGKLMHAFPTEDEDVVYKMPVANQNLERTRNTAPLK